MNTLILLAHFFISVGLIALILLQRSEGGALGIGGGGGGGLMSGRGAANLLTRATSALAFGFFITSILLTVVTNRGGPSSVADRVNSPLSPASFLEQVEQEAEETADEDAEPQPVLPDD